MNRMPAFTCSLLIVLSSLLALAAAGEVRAEVKADFELRAVQADQAAPRVVRAGEAFTLVFSGVWLDSCVPRLLGFEGEGHRRVLVLEARPITQASGKASIIRRVVSPVPMPSSSTRSGGKGIAATDWSWSSS